MMVSPGATFSGDRRKKFIAIWSLVPGNLRSRPRAGSETRAQLLPEGGSEIRARELIEMRTTLDTSRDLDLDLMMKSLTDWLYDQFDEAVRDKLSAGGYVIVDDYGNVAGCRQTVHGFRARRGIN